MIICAVWSDWTKPIRSIVYFVSFDLINLIWGVFWTRWNSNILVTASLFVCLSAPNHLIQFVQDVWMNKFDWFDSFDHLHSVIWSDSAASCFGWGCTRIFLQWSVVYFVICLCHGHTVFVTCAFILSSMGTSSCEM